MEISHIDPNGTAERITIIGDYAYVAYGYNGLQIFDISDPTNPNIAGYFDADNDVARYYANDVAVSGNTIYLAYANFGLAIIRNDLILDVKNNINPIIGSFKLQQNYPNPFNPKQKLIIKFLHQVL